MATNKYQELQGFSDQDLKAELAETSQQYQKLKFDHVIKGLDNPLLIREMRRDLARLRTEIRRREIAAMNTEELANRTKIRARRRK
jgi:large subunit ribosomal protein L29